MGTPAQPALRVRFLRVCFRCFPAESCHHSSKSPWCDLVSEPESGSSVNMDHPCLAVQQVIGDRQMSWKLNLHPPTSQTCQTLPVSGTRLLSFDPPPPTTLIPHIEVGFKWMWTQLATPNKMAPVFVDLCAGLVVLLPRQNRRFRHGFFSSAVLDWSLRSCVRVRHLWRQQIADNRRYLRRSFLPWTSSLRSQISLSKRR